MKYLLAAINAKYIHSSPAVYLLRESVPPVLRGLVGIAEYTINEYPDQILASIFRQKPDLLAISCYIWNERCVDWLLPELAKVLPDTQIWLGGPEVCYRGEEVLQKYPSVTGVFLGEGEVSFPALVKALERESANESMTLEDVPGILFRQSNGAFLKTTSALVPDLDSLPFIYDDLTPFENRILYYESSRGCPFSCAYCLSSREEGLRFKSLPAVFGQLQFFLDHQVRQVKFLDRSFNCGQERTLAIWSYLKEHDNGVTNFHFELEPQLLTKDEVDFLQALRPGQVKVEIGVQTTNEKALAALGRRADFARLSRDVSALLAPGNIHVHLDLIAGLPHEDLASFRQSFNDVYRLHPHELQLGFLKVLHGTPIKEQARRFGISYLDKAPYEVLSTNWLTYEEIIHLKQVEEVLEIYYNSGQFSAAMRVLEESFPDPFAMYEALADFYDRNGLFVQTPARIRRYMILLDFIKEQLAGKDTALFEELLTWDLYLRENMKSRPPFAPPRVYQKRREDLHEEIFHYPVHQISPFGSNPLPEGLRDAGDFRIRFDYSRRDPVTRNASIELLQEI